MRDKEEKRVSKVHGVRTRIGHQDEEEEEDMEDFEERPNGCSPT